MNFSADKSQVMEIYCDWLKTNCSRYEYLTDEARKLCHKIKDMDIQSMSSKEYYLKFLSMFVNNPFVTASSLWMFQEDEAYQSMEQIVSKDYRCYFIKNRFGMWVPLELYCRLAVYRSENELTQMQSQEQNKLSEDYEAYIQRSQHRKKSWETGSAGRKQIFIGFLKGPGELKSHPFTAILVISFSALFLWLLYESCFTPAVRVLISENKWYAAMIIGGALFGLYAMIQGFWEFGNIWRKKKVRRSVGQAEELEKEICESFGKGREIFKNLKDFVEQVLKAGKAGISDPQVLVRAQISDEGRDTCEKYKTVESCLEKMKKNIKRHTRFGHLVVLGIAAFTFRQAGLIRLDDLDLNNHEKGEQIEETETQVPQTEAPESEILWKITADDCNLRQSPNGDIITVLSLGTRLEVLGTDDTGEWLQVMTEYGDEGYVSRLLARQVREDEVIVEEALATSERKTQKYGTLTAINAFDGNLMTSWQEGAKGYGIGQQLTARFEPCGIYQVTFINGNVLSEDSYYQNGRVKTLTMFAADGEWKVEFPDEYNLEGVSFTMDEAFTAGELTFRIDEVYEGTVYEDTCIAEISLYGK